MWNSTEGYARAESYDFPAIRIAWNETLGGGNRATTACNVSFIPAQTVVDCPELEPRKIWLNLYADELTSTCTVKLDYVETEVICAGRTCEAKRIRQSKQPHPSTNWTPLDVWTGNGSPGYSVSSLFLTNLANVVAGRNNDGGGSNALSGFIADPANPFRAVASFSGTSALQSLSHDLINSRLTQFLNTYWTISVGEPLIIGTDDTYAIAANLTHNSGSPIPGDASTLTNITASALTAVDTSEELLRCDERWLSILTIITIIGLLASAAGLVLAALYKGPRFSMDMSTMVRDNKYCSAEVDHAGSWKDDGERSALLANVQVRMGDVNPHENVGHVALSTSRGEAMSKLEKDRLYD